MNVGIIGLGIVGKSIRLAFGQHCKLFINDKKVSKYAPHSIEEVVKNCNFIFVNVPTPFNTLKNKIDTTIIDIVMDNINSISNDNQKKPIVIIKSAVVPRVVKEWLKKYLNINIIISPEFLKERSSIHDFVNQEVMILGGDRNLCKRVKRLYIENSICNKRCEVGYCTAEEAAIIKYMENSFLAVKNIFINQFKTFYDVHFDCKENYSFNALMDVFHLDKRMGVFNHPYRVPGPDGDFGYGGKCLPKDTQSIISEGDSQGTSMTLLKVTKIINDRIRTEKDWEKIEGAMINEV